MKKISIILIIKVLCLISCTPQQRFTIVNNSEETILVVHNNKSVKMNPIYDIHPEENTKSEYNEMLNFSSIKPHSNKNIDYWGDYIRDTPNDTMYLGIFFVIDLDTMSLEEFKTKYPIRYEFKVTLQDMINRDWTLVYPPYD